MYLLTLGIVSSRQALLCHSVPSSSWSQGITPGFWQARLAGHRETTEAFPSSLVSKEGKLQNTQGESSFTAPLLVLGPLSHVHASFS